MRPDSVYGADANPGATREGAGNATACVESSRFAAPSLRYGPSGDTTPPVAKKFTMAGSELPAMADRRAHSLGKLQGRRQPPYTTQEKPYPRPRSRGLENRKSNCRRRQLHLSLSSRRLRQTGETACWDTLRRILEGHQRITATFRRDDGRTLHVRKATRAEPPQQALYDALGVTPQPGAIRKTIV